MTTDDKKRLAEWLGIDVCITAEDVVTYNYYPYHTTEFDPYFPDIVLMALEKLIETQETKSLLISHEGDGKWCTYPLPLPLLGGSDTLAESIIAAALAAGSE